MTKKINKTQLNQKTVMGKKAFFLLQYGIKKNQEITTLLGIIKALRILVNELENDLAVYHYANKKASN